MKIIHAESYDDLSRKAAEIIAAQIKSKPDSVLGLVTRFRGNGTGNQWNPYRNTENSGIKQHGN